MQQHLDRLSSVDAGFLAQEGPTTHMHIGGIVLLDGPPPQLDEFLAHVRSRLHLVPRYRQKIAHAPLETGLPLWIDDPSFNLEYHVRHSALPTPGDEQTLLRIAARIFSQPLDRAKPLWELWLIEGLGDGGFALVQKTHHAVVDGISGVDLATVLFDLSPEGTDAGAPQPWVPHPEPSRAELLARGLQGAARRVAEVATESVSQVAHPQELLGRAREVAGGVGEVAMTAIRAPSPTPFNVKPGPHRRIAVVRAELAEFKAIKTALGGTVNDVVLAVVAGGLAHFFRERGWRTDGVELRACVPVSLRSPDQRGALGNELTVMMAPLPIDVPDAVGRLQRVREVMDGLKESKQALGAKTLANLQDFAPPTIFAQASRLNFSSRMYNLLVTNVPGPQVPLYVLGRCMRAIFPVPFLAGDRSLAIAIMSYDGGMDFGLLGDYDVMHDLDVVAEGIEGALGELLAITRRRARVESRKAKRRTTSSGAGGRSSAQTKPRAR